MQKGNVLFLILIAVALFAALSYTVTQTNRSPQSTISDDKAKLLAAEILGYGASIEHAISSMTLINKVPDYGFDLSTTGYSAAATNTTCSDGECNLFNTRGGNVSPKLLPRDAWDETNSSMMSSWLGRMWFRSLSVEGIGSEKPDLLLMYPGVKEEVCLAINDRVGIANNNDGTPPTDSNGADGTNFIAYSGDLTAFPTPSSTAIALGDEATQIAGKRTFCVGNNATDFFYWHVLLAR